MKEVSSKIKELQAVTDQIRDSIKTQHKQVIE